jgi:hypothetical protein
MKEYKVSNKSYVSQKVATERSESGSVKSRLSAVKINIINPEDRSSSMLKKT